MGTWMRRHWWQLVLAVVAVALVGWAVLRRDDLEFGDLGGWVGGGIALAALGVSLYLIRRDQELRHRELVREERRQAELVSCWVSEIRREALPGEYVRPVGDPRVRVPCVIVRNDSETPVYNVVLQPEPFDPHGAYHASHWAVLPPGLPVKGHWPTPPDEPSSSRPLLNCIDTAGIQWQRDGRHLRIVDRRPAPGPSFDMVVPPLPYDASQASPPVSAAPNA